MSIAALCVLLVCRQECRFLRLDLRLDLSLTLLMNSMWWMKTFCLVQRTTAQKIVCVAGAASLDTVDMYINV